MRRKGTHYFWKFQIWRKKLYLFLCISPNEPVGRLFAIQATSVDICLPISQFSIDICGTFKLRNQFSVERILLYWSYARYNYLVPHIPNIIFVGTPFKVSSIVVKWVSIPMVHFGQVVRIAYKCHCHEPMHILPYFFAVITQHHTQVPCTCYMLIQYTPLT